MLDPLLGLDTGIDIIIIACALLHLQQVLLRLQTSIQTFLNFRFNGYTVCTVVKQVVNANISI